MTNLKINYLGTFSLFLFMASIVFISIYHAQNIQADVAFNSTINISNDSVKSLDPQITASGNNVYVIWTNQTGIDTTTAEIYFKSSANNGASFGSAINLSNSPGVVSEIPQINASNNRVYAIWSDDSDPSFTNKTEGGTFDSAVHLNTISSMSYSPQIAVSNGHVYIVWNEASDKIFFANSTDDGDSFHAAINLANGGITTALEPEITASSGRAYIVWHEDTNIVFKNSTSSGDFNFAPAILGTADDAGTDSDTPQIAVSGNNVYSVWKKSNDIFFANSTDDGDSFHAAINLSNSGAISELPQVAASGNNVYVIWHEGSSIYFTASTNKGDNFSTPISIGTTGATAGTGTPQIIATGNNVYAIWEDSTSNDDVIFKSSSDNGATFCNSNNISNDVGTSAIPQIALSGSNLYALWRNDTSAATDSEVFFKSGLVTTECIQFNTSQYRLSETATITINDPSANGNIDTKNINIKSNSDTTGINLIFTETSANSGVFTGSSITFTTGQSSGSTLKASAGDTITATTTAGQTSTASIYPITVDFRTITDISTTGYLLGDRALIKVTDKNSNVNPLVAETITISVSSPSDSTNLNLVETGPNTDVFAKDTLIFMTGNDRFVITDTPTITQDESNAGFITVGTPNRIGIIDPVRIYSDSDPLPGGITVVLNETSSGSGSFSKILSFTAGASIPGSSIKVTNSDIVSVKYRDEVANGIIIPITNSSIGAIQADIGNTVTASFRGASDSAIIIIGTGGGGGGGGVSRAGLVVQAVGAIALFGGGGSHSGPPSFDSTVFSLETDGVKISPESLSTSTSSFTVGKKSDISMGFKMPGGLNDLDHIGLYANIGPGQDKYDTDTYIYFDRFKTPQITIHDPHGFFKSVNLDVTEPTQGNIDTNFVFDFAKSLDNSNVVFEAWNIKRDSATKEIPDLLKVADPTKPEDIVPKDETITQTTEERPPVPDWVKSNAAWWGKGAIDDNEFTNGIGYLIQKQIIDVPGLLEKNTSPEKIINPDTGVMEEPEEFVPLVPAWVKNNALWWSEGQLTDDDFLIGIKYLLEKGIIQVRI